MLAGIKVCHSCACNERNRPTRGATCQRSAVFSIQEKKNDVSDFFLFYSFICVCRSGPGAAQKARDRFRHAVGTILVHLDAITKHDVVACDSCVVVFFSSVSITIMHVIDVRNWSVNSSSCSGHKILRPCFRLPVCWQWLGIRNRHRWCAAIVCLLKDDSRTDRMVSAHRRCLSAYMACVVM